MNINQCLHHCTIDLVIGTLYCSRKTFDFGIQRTIKSLQPVEKKLNPGTWFYAKRNFVFLCECLAKHTAVLKENMQTNILQFLDKVDEYGKDLPSENGALDAADVMGGEYTGSAYLKSQIDQGAQSAKDNINQQSGGGSTIKGKGATIKKKKGDEVGSGQGGQGASQGQQGGVGTQKTATTVSAEARLIKRMFLKLWEFG
ncbi:MAG: putative flagellar associated protein [Streblomastix strix]|uniref:Putative flagellar associated protein n=1 Tax=Streblomastix strix TaxID=222440 RepID=A0A5J4VPG2_9EUKA|nr:MAG: putative flagellar associated protein [Streblomastix strix]